MDSTLPKTHRPRSRQSLAHVPVSSTTGDGENATTDIGALQRDAVLSRSVLKKSRGKSLGPGGIEALKETTGNAIRVSCCYPRCDSL